MPNWSDGDSNACPSCGIDMEVIGPPGPRHRKGCGWVATETRRQKEDEENARLREQEWLNRMFPRQRTDLDRYFDDVLMKHHAGDLLYLDDFEF
jgi:hypothetical protein